MATLWAVQEIGITDPVEMLIETTRQVAVLEFARLRGIVIDEGLVYPERDTDGGGRDIAAEGPPERIADILVMLAQMGLTGYTVQVEDEREAAVLWSAFETLSAQRGYRRRDVWIVGPDNELLGQGDASR